MSHHKSNSMHLATPESHKPSHKPSPISSGPITSNPSSPFTPFLSPSTLSDSVVGIIDFLALSLFFRRHHRIHLSCSLLHGRYGLRPSSSSLRLSTFCVPCSRTIPSSVCGL